jgi:hypothetical protein
VRTSLSEPEGERVSDLIEIVDPSGIREFKKNELKLKTMRDSPDNWV